MAGARGRTMIAVILLGSSCAGLWAADDKSISRVAAPGWVEVREADLALPADAVDDQGETTRYLLRDFQRHVGEGREYRHIAYRLLNREGLQNGATLKFEFDPAYERLEFHRLVVQRDGQQLDRLAEQEIKVFQRETNLEDQIYDGRLTASLILDGIRVGDVIDYAYSRCGSNPLFAGHTLGGIDTERTLFLHQLHERLLCPANRPQPRFQGHRTSVQPEVCPLSPELTEYRWEAQDLPAQLVDRDVPSWIDTLGWVQYSDFQTWGEVARWAASLFASAGQDRGAPLPEELEKEAAALEKGPEGPGRAVEALRYVQDNFRYLGIEIGDSSHKPYPVATVCERRFGDCKDKANLLCALLRRLGFEADPALVSTGYRQEIATWLPTPTAFDHAIVRVLREGRAYWLDPTRNHQGGTLDHVYLPAYGKALVVRAETEGLEEIVPGGREDTTVEVLNTLQHTNYAEPPTLQVRTTFRGFEADAMRDTRATTSAQEFDRDYLNYYARWYPKVRARHPIRFHDDLERNELVSEEEYELPEAWEVDSTNPAKLHLSLFPGSVNARLMSPATRLRTLPYRLRFPSHVTERFAVQLARGFNLSPEHMEIKDAAFDFNFRSERTSEGALRLLYEYHSRAPQVAAERTADYSANVKRVREQMEYILTRANPLHAAPPTTSRPAAAKLDQVDVITGIFYGGCTIITLSWLMVRRVIRKRRAATAAPSPSSLHRCVICRRTEESHPELEFRVGQDGHDYCAEHLRRSTAPLP